MRMLRRKRLRPKMGLRTLRVWILSARVLRIRTLRVRIRLVRILRLRKSRVRILRVRVLRMNDGEDPAGHWRGTSAAQEPLVGHGWPNVGAPVATPPRQAARKTMRSSLRVCAKAPSSSSERRTKPRAARNPAPKKATNQKPR